MRTIAFLLCCLAVAKGYPSGSFRITDGTNAAITDFPFLVSITYRDDHICGGFIYNERYVVTTASCVIDYKNLLLDLNVIAGQVNLILPEPTEQRKQVRAVYTHESYVPETKLNNIALVELTNSFNVSGDAVNVGIYDEVDRDANLIARFAGWGAVEAGALASIELQETTLRIFTTGEECLVYGEVEFQTNTMVCAGIYVGAANETTSGGYPCEYDEGSPLVQKVKDAAGYEFEGMVGIMSKNLGCDVENRKSPTVFTRLSAYYAWMFRIAGAQPPPA